MAHRVPFFVAELGPDVDPFVLHLYATLAEKERALSPGGQNRRLQRRRRRAPKLGNPSIKAAQAAAVSAVKAGTDRAASNVLPIIAEIRKSGSTTLRTLPKLSMREGFRRRVADAGTP